MESASVSRSAYCRSPALSIWLGAQEALWILAEGLSVPPDGLEDRFSCLTLGKRTAEQETGWSDSTRRLYRNGLERNIRPRIGDMRLRELSTGMLDELIADVRDQRPYTILIDGRRVTKRVGGIGAAKQCRLLLRLALDQAVRWDAVPTNPARSVRAVKDEKKPIEV